jgi:hypothetical protein
MFLRARAARHLEITGILYNTLSYDDQFKRDAFAF